MPHRRRFHQLVQFAAQRPEFFEQRQVAVCVLAPADLLLQRHRDQGRPAPQLIAGQQVVPLAALLDLDLALDHRDTRALDAVGHREDRALDRHEHLLGRHDERPVLLLRRLNDHAAPVDPDAIAAAAGIDAEGGETRGLDPRSVRELEHAAAAGAGADPDAAVNRVAGGERHEFRVTARSGDEHPAVHALDLDDPVLGGLQNLLAEPDTRGGHAGHRRRGRVVAADTRRRRRTRRRVRNGAAGTNCLQVLAAGNALSGVILDEEALGLGQGTRDQSRHPRLVVGARGQGLGRGTGLAGFQVAGFVARGRRGNGAAHPLRRGRFDRGWRLLGCDRPRRVHQGPIPRVAVAHRRALPIPSSPSSFLPDPGLLVSVCAGSSESARLNRLRRRCSVTATVIREVPIIGPISEFR